MAPTNGFFLAVNIEPDGSLRPPWVCKRGIQFSSRKAGFDLAGRKVVPESAEVGNVLSFPVWITSKSLKHIL